MATVKLEVVSGANTWGRTKTISGPDLQRFANAYKIQEGTPDATNQQVVEALAEKLFDWMRSVVKRQEVDAAKAAAEAGVGDIVIS